MNTFITYLPPKELIIAIKQRLIVTFIYEDLPRLVEPYICGVFGNGHTALMSYQIDGQCQIGLLPSWRTFAIEKISHIQLTSENFLLNQPDYNPNDDRFFQIFAQI